MVSPNTQIEQKDKVVVATIGAPQVTHLEMEELCDELTQRMRYDNTTLFVLDLASVEFLASACLGIMVTFLQDLEQVRGRVVLANCGPSVAFLFKVTRLDAAFSLYDDVDEAIEGIERGCSPAGGCAATSG